MSCVQLWLALKAVIVGWHDFSRYMKSLNSFLLMIITKVLKLLYIHTCMHTCMVHHTYKKQNYYNYYFFKLTAICINVCKCKGIYVCNANVVCTVYKPL